jgi:Protein of unknown function (DUF2917)
MMWRGEKRRNAMNLKTDELQAVLRQGQTARLHDALGLEIQVNEGCLWLTQERDLQDHVIEAGASFRIDQPGVAVLTALKGLRMKFTLCSVPVRPLQLALAL